MWCVAVYQPNREQGGLLLSSQPLFQAGGTTPDAIVTTSFGIYWRSLRTTLAVLKILNKLMQMNFRHYGIVLLALFSGYSTFIT